MRERPIRFVSEGDTLTRSTLVPRFERVVGLAETGPTPDGSANVARWSARRNSRWSEPGAAPGRAFGAYRSVTPSYTLVMATMSTCPVASANPVIEPPGACARRLGERWDARGQVDDDLLGQDQSALRVAWRDLSAFPDLNRRFLDERLQIGFEQMTTWVTALAEANEVELEDPEATAAVLSAPLPSSA